MNTMIKMTCTHQKGKNTQYITPPNKCDFKLSKFRLVLLNDYRTMPLVNKSSGFI